MGGKGEALEREMNEPKITKCRPGVAGGAHDLRIWSSRRLEGLAGVPSKKVLKKIRKQRRKWRREFEKRKREPLRPVQESYLIKGEKR